MSLFQSCATTSRHVAMRFATAAAKRGLTSSMFSASQRFISCRLTKWPSMLATVRFFPMIESLRRRRR